MKKAFTLVEMLIVIGIICLLAGVLLTVTGGGTESARAAKCLSNIRSLAQAANSAALEDSQNNYPKAGSVATMGGLDSLGYNEKAGWISWLSNHGHPFPSSSPEPPTVDECRYDTDNLEDARYALTNGVIWQAVNKSEAVYICPTHLLNCRRAGVTPVWSYVMNGRFGYTDKNDPSAAERKCPYGGFRDDDDHLIPPDRVLMFAEMAVVKTGSAAEKDAILQYKASVNGKNYNMNWSGEPESIAFNHKSNRNRLCGHVAFADGHCEKFLQSSGAGGLTPDQLTALLCEGKDVSFNGKIYQEIREED